MPLTAAWSRSCDQKGQLRISSPQEQRNVSIWPVRRVPDTSLMVATRGWLARRKESSVDPEYGLDARNT